MMTICCFTSFSTLSETETMSGDNERLCGMNSVQKRAEFWLLSLNPVPCDP